MFVAPVFVFLMTGVAIPRIIGDSKSERTPPPLGKDEQVEVVDLVPINSSDDDTRIEIAARNIGETVSVLTRVDFEFFAEPDFISTCGSGAVLGVSQEYDLELPQRAEVGDIVPVRISHEIRPDEADRFAFNVGVEVPPNTAEPQPIIYRLGVRLYHDGKEEPIKVGEVILAEPFPSRFGYFDEEDYRDTGIPPEIVKDCIASNRASVRGLLPLPGVMSPELTELSRSLQ